MPMKHFVTLLVLLACFFSPFNCAVIHGQALMEKAAVSASGAASRPITKQQTNISQQSGSVRHTLHSKNAMTAEPYNYKWFTEPYKQVSNEALAANAGYEHHPELGMLFPETPCDNCYELIGKRTDISKTFIVEGSGGKHIMQQTSTDAMHYRDTQGNWRTIKTKLEPDNAHKGIYAAYEQPVPVRINTNSGNTAIGKEENRRRKQET